MKKKKPNRPICGSDGRLVSVPRPISPFQTLVAWFGTCCTTKTESATKKVPEEKEGKRRHFEHKNTFKIFKKQVIQTDKLQVRRHACEKENERERKFLVRMCAICECEQVCVIVRR